MAHLGCEKITLHPIILLLNIQGLFLIILITHTPNCHHPFHHHHNMIVIMMIIEPAQLALQCDQYEAASSCQDDPCLSDPRAQASRSH